jgi:hypothetical protein
MHTAVRRRHAVGKPSLWPFITKRGAGQQANEANEEPNGVETSNMSGVVMIEGRF